MLRRIFSASIASVALVALAVPLLIVAFLIRLTSPGPALFRQQRVGKFSRPFVILKFRTMVADTAHLSPITIGIDTRITPIGSFLRRTKIDELPQLINVIKGEMNLVGPRPELPQYVNKYPAADRALVLSMAPGLTDFASIRYRNESQLLAETADPLEYYMRVLLPRKLRYARFYVRRATVSLDLYIIWLTICSLIRDASGKRVVPRNTPGCQPSRSLVHSKRQGDGQYTPSICCRPISGRITHDNEGDAPVSDNTA
jgi:lipopolysaccharide/colanic/teichoic acid biosynthesis glycosyltransferase